MNKGERSGKKQKEKYRSPFAQLKLKKLKEFIDGNPSLWAIAWALLWRLWILGFAFYFTIVIFITIFVTFAVALAKLLA